MVKSDDPSVSNLISQVPEEVWREVFREKLERMNIDHTESPPQTTPEKPQTVDHVHVESSSRPLWDVDEEYDESRGLDLLSSVTVLIAEYEDKENKSKKDKPRAYSEPTNKEEEKFKEDVLNLWVRKFEQRSTTSVEPLLQNPNLDSESSPNNKEGIRRRKKPKIVDGLEVEPLQMTLPGWLLNVMGEDGYNPKLISTRKLYKSDLRRDQSRLLVPFKQVKNPDFLTEVETSIIDEQAEKRNTKGLSVDLVDPKMKKREVNLRKWNMSGNWYYAFVDGWNVVVAANSFKIDDVFPLWSFRSGSGKLCFALVPPTTTNSDQGGITSEESGGDGASTSDESDVSVPTSPPARDSSFSGQGCLGGNSSSSS